MNELSRERWQQLEQLADAALDLPVEERSGFLRTACGDDAELHAWVVKLLEAGEAPDRVLDTAAADYAPGLARLAGPSAQATPPPLPRIGPYRIVRELGRGGMGIVYLAERAEHFQQRLALKLVRRGLHLDPELVQRFVAERQILATLEHPNIARLLDGGLTDDGVPWFAMELVSGDPVNEACDARRLSIEARLELFCTVCDAVEYAHRRQVVHRDLKPSNILVNAEGAVKLVDFGIAKLVAPDSAAEQNLTRTGARLLTPEYASPEQLLGRTVSPASDVYSLGVLLYELLTGRRPYRVTGRAPEDVEQAVLRQEPARPSTVVRRTTGASDADGSPPDAAQRARARGTTPEQLSQRLRGYLDAIVLRALAKDPALRHSSAAELAIDVRRYLEGLPIARPPRLPSRRRFAVFPYSSGAPAQVERPRSWRQRILAIATLCLALAAGLFSLYRPSTIERRSAAPIPSIAVLPFTSGDDNDAYFSDGVAEDIISMLARAPDLTVASRSATFTYKGRTVDPRLVGRELGVDYVLEGSVRKGIDRVRITAQLIDARTGNDVWAERFDRAGVDPWQLQDEVASKIVSALSGEYGQLKRTQYRQAWGRDSTTLAEYDYYLRGHEYYMRLTYDDNERAGEIWREGLTRFPDSPLLKVKLGFYHFMRGYLYYAGDATADFLLAGELARSVLATRNLSPLTRRLGHWLLAYVSAQERDFDRAVKEAEITRSLAPYDAFAMGDVASILIMACRTTQAVEWIDEAIAADPANRPVYKQLRGWALSVHGDYEGSIADLKEAFELPAVPLLQAVNYAENGRLEEAKAEVRKALRRDPQMTQERWRLGNYYFDAAILERQLARLSEAGLPKE